MANFTMYDREREFKWQIECQLSGGTYAYIDAEDIYSGRLTRQISSGEGIEVGSCYVSELDLTIVASAIPSNVVSVKPYFRLLTSTEIVDDVVHKYYTPYNLGVFKIASTKRKEYGRIDLVCYDKMADLDMLITPAAYTELLASDWKPFYLLDWIATKVGVTYTFTQSGIEAMPNGTLYFKLTEETSNIKTYRDLLQYVCMLIGAYGIFDEDGHLNVKTFADVTSYSLPASFRFSESFGDVPISYSGVELTVKNVTTMFGNANNTVVRLSDNPFLYNLSTLNQTTDYATFIMQFLRNIYTEFQGLSYYAGEFEIPPDASLNVGRLLNVSGGGATNTINCFLQKIDVNFDGRMALSCGNPNTYVARTQNRTTTSIANLTNRIETLESSQGGGKEVYYGTTLPTVDIGQDSSLYYKIIQRPEDLKTLNVVEYIQSETASYIPTDILMTNNTRIMMQGIFYQGDYNGGQVAFGTYGNDLDNRAGKFIAGTSAFRDNNDCFFFFGNDSVWYDRSCEGIYGTDVMLMADTATRTLTISGGGASHSVTTPSSFLYTPSSTPIGILCANTSSEIGGFSVWQDWRDLNDNAIIKRFQVYNNNILAYDLIPVQNADNVADCGLYDRIHRKYYPGVNYNNNTPFTAGTPTGEVINQLDECVEAGYLRVNDEWWEIYNGGTEYFAGNYIEITENNVITSTLKAGTNIQIADDGTISASGAEIVQTVTSGTQLATINGTSIYAPTVSATQTQTSGTEIGNITVGNTNTKLYAPTTTVTQTLTEGTEIAQVNGTSLYAPTGGGSDVTVTPKTSTGTNIADISVDGTTYQLFAPSGGGGGGSSGSGYTETSLWSGTQTTTGTITLSDNVQNYDAIVIRWSPHRLSTDYFQQTSMILTSSIVLGSTYQYLFSSMIVGNQYSSCASCHFEDYTHFTLDEITTSTYFPIFALLEVVGLKFSTTETAFIYSNEERVVGVWTDNKPLYQKTINFGMLPLTATKTVAHNIANVDKIWIYDGFVYNSTDGIFSQLNRTTNSLTYQWETKVDRTNVIMQDYAAFGNDSSAIITVQYTKTTDTPGSAPYVTSGAYAHHYSTTEQVVGTWIDGSTLYEKTQYGGITFSSQGTWYDTDITNIDKVVSVEGSINRDGEPINLGYWNGSIVSCWILRNHTLKMSMQAMSSSETYTLNSVTVRYTKTS